MDAPRQVDVAARAVFRRDCQVMLQRAPDARSFPPPEVLGQRGEEGVEAVAVPCPHQGFDAHPLPASFHEEVECGVVPERSGRLGEEQVDQSRSGVSHVYRGAIFDHSSRLEVWESMTNGNSLRCPRHGHGRRLRHDRPLWLWILRGKGLPHDRVTGLVTRPGGPVWS